MPKFIWKVVLMDVVLLFITVSWPEKILTILLLLMLFKLVQTD
ncbi:hypothetical protein [Salmonella enterica]|nr:hypothetical protein [Salmonella enterica]